MIIFKSTDAKVINKRIVVSSFKGSIFRSIAKKKLIEHYAYEKWNAISIEIARLLKICRQVIRDIYGWTGNDIKNIRFSWQVLTKASQKFCQQVIL